MDEPGRLKKKETRDAIRTFICIEIPGPIKDRIGVLQGALKGPDTRVSWVKPDNIHLTLKFLGDVPASRTDAVYQSVDRAAQSVRTFKIELGGAGCFPSVRSPRILWVGLKKLPDELLRLHGNIEDELAREGFPRDQKRFAPHLTIGRIRSSRGASEAADRLILKGFEAEDFTASEVIVMRSDLNPRGSIYTRLAMTRLVE